LKGLKREIASSLHISGKYDMEMLADKARTKGYARTFGEHVWKTDRNRGLEIDGLKERLDLLQTACDEVAYL
jgi:hypothetical protein